MAEQWRDGLAEEPLRHESQPPGGALPWFPLAGVQACKRLELDRSPQHKKKKKDYFGKQIFFLKW